MVTQPRAIFFHPSSLNLEGLLGRHGPVVEGVVGEHLQDGEDVVAARPQHAHRLLAAPPEGPLHARRAEPVHDVPRQPGRKERHGRLEVNLGLNGNVFDRYAE